MIFRLSILMFFTLVGFYLATNHADAREPQNQKTNKSAVELKTATPKKSERKKIQRKPDGTLGYRYTCSPSGFGQMGKCW